MQQIQANIIVVILVTTLFIRAPQGKDATQG